MGSIRGFVGRHVGVLLALLMSPFFVILHAAKAPRLRVLLPEHEARVVEFSPDSRVMVTDGASGGCVRDPVTGRVLVGLMRAGAADPGDQHHLASVHRGRPARDRSARRAEVRSRADRHARGLRGGDGTGVCLVRRGRFGNLVGIVPPPPRSMRFRPTDQHWRSVGSSIVGRGN